MTAESEASGHNAISLQEGRAELPKTVYILVLNWNGWKDTNDCLASLKKLNYDRWKVVVIDNASTDDSAARIHERFPEVEIVQLEGNLGYAKGNNSGIRLALERGAEYVWLLNNDTTVDSEALRAMVHLAEENPRIGAVGSAVYYASQPNRVQAWGGGYVDFRLGRARHFTGPVADTEIEFLTGTSLLLRRPILESLGLLDEGFFMYWEDTDYSFRLREAGLQLAVAPQSKIFHKGSASFKSNALLDNYFTKSSARFFRKHAKFPAFPFWMGVVLRLTKRVIQGRWDDLRAVWSGAISGSRRSRD